MSNTIGGIILFGIKDDGTLSESDVSHISSIDVAVITCSKRTNGYIFVVNRFDVFRKDKGTLAK